MARYRRLIYVIGDKPYAHSRRITIERLSPRHAAIYPRLREIDLKEMAASSPLNPMLQLGYSIAASRPGYAILYDKQIVVVFGVTDDNKGTGVPWLLATNELKKHRFEFYRMSRLFISEMQELYDRLENYVHVDNKLSIRWLGWAGFKFDEPVGEFMRFYWTRGENDVHGGIDSGVSPGAGLAGVCGEASGGCAGGGGGTERSDIDVAGP